jgi:hypothetical protein
MIPPRPGSGHAATVPLPYLLTAAISFVGAALGALWLASELSGHYYHPRLLALTHTVTLGWITLTIMGASYQLIPIVLQRPIWSERLARWQFWVLVVSIAGMVGHFYVGTWAGLVTAAALLALGIGAHLLNVGLSLRGFNQWSFTARLIVLAYAALALTVAFGLALGVDRVRAFLPFPFFPELHAHFHLALLGWITPMVFGVGARVYPMFLLAAEAAGWPAQLQWWGLAVGVPAVALGLLGVPALTGPGALAVAVAVFGHTLWVARMVRHRTRPRLDWGLRLVLTGTAFLFPVTLLGLGFAFGLLSGPQLGTAYAVLALGGWVSLTIAGMMLKIVPFLVWYRIYAPQVGKAQVPALPQLAWPAAEATAYGLLTAAMILLPIAIATGHVVWIRATAAVLSLGALAFGVSLGRILWHLARGTARAAAARPAAAPAR